VRLVAADGGECVGIGDEATLAQAVLLQLHLPAQGLDLSLELPGPRPRRVPASADDPRWAVPTASPGPAGRRGPRGQPPCGGRPPSSRPRRRHPATRGPTQNRA
jgi:hypothetical protein